MGRFKEFWTKLFKRCKKISPLSSTNPTSTAISPNAFPTRANDKAPQLPPLQTNQNPIEFTNKPLPPTHPLATGEKSTRQVAVPQKAAAHFGLSPVQNSKGAGSVLAEGRILQQQQIPGELATGPPSTVNGDGKDDVSAVSAEDVPPPPPPKEDNVEPLAIKEHTHIPAATPAHYETPNTIAVENEMVTKQAQPWITNPDPITPTTAAEPLPTTAQRIVSSTVEQNVPPSSTTVDSTTSHTMTTPATEQTSGSPDRPKSADGKMLLMEEPPPIKPINIAPGMSATSGPLEDFPEGGEPLVD